MSRSREAFRCFQQRNDPPCLFHPPSHPHLPTHPPTHPPSPTRYCALHAPPPSRCSLDLNSRFSIVGPNGIGKSTLLGLISGELEPTRGHVHRNPKVRRRRGRRGQRGGRHMCDGRGTGGRVCGEQGAGAPYLPICCLDPACYFSAPFSSSS